MTTNRRVYFAKAMVALAALPVLIYAYSAGPEPRKTGGPGDGLCTECHGPVANSAGGKVSVQFPGGLVYSPGVKQRLTVLIEDPVAKVYGFQLSTRLASNPQSAQAGRLDTVDAITQVICEDGGLRPAAGCSATLPLEFIEHNQPNTVNTFSVDWTPPAAGSGDVNIYVAANAANGNGQNDPDDHIYTASYTLSEAAATGNKPTVAAGGVVNAWSFQAVISDGGWVSIFGSNLSSTTRIWRPEEIVNGKLPTILDGVQVSINNRPAAVYFISSGQLNVQAPSDGSVGPVEIRVTTAAGTSDPVTVMKQALAPAFFTWAGSVVGGEKYPGAVISDGTFAGKAGLLAPLGITTRPVKPGDVVLLFGTGFGATTPDSSGGQTVPTPARMNTPITVLIGGQAAQVFDTGYLIYPGEYQVNVKIPDVADGDQPVVIQMGSVRSPDNVYLTVQR